jgi:hypothetical protein
LFRQRFLLAVSPDVSTECTSEPHGFGLGVSVPGLESASWPEPLGCQLEALARFFDRTRSRPAHRIDLSEHKIRSGSCSTSPLSGPRLSVDYKRTWSTRPPDSGATGTERTLASSRSKLAAQSTPPAAFLHEIPAPPHRICRVGFLPQPLASRGRDD